MKAVKNILKGMVIGIANVIPGVSGGTMMVAMGIYDKLIHCITHIFKEFKKSVLFLIPIAIGMGIAALAFIVMAVGIAVIGGSLGIEMLFDKFPVQTNLLFIGLIVGGLPAIWKNVKGKSIRFGHILAFLAFFVLVVVMAFMGEQEGNAVDLSFNFVNVLKLFAVGVVAAATMVIPGVSGSMVLLLMGYYNPILTAINDFLRALTAWDMDGILNGIGILMPFGIGVIVGVLAIAKLIEFIFNKFPLYAYWAIIGLIVASPIAIIAMASLPALTVVNVLTGIVALCVGVFVAMKLGD